MTLRMSNKREELPVFEDWMELHMLSRKRRLCDGNENEPPLYTKKCLANLKALLDRYETYTSDRSTHHAGLKTSWRPTCSCETFCVNDEAVYPTIKNRFSEQISSWADTQFSVKKVLEHLRFRQATDDIFLNDLVNKKFLEFHSYITEECGTEDKQHSWAVIEKQEEIVMYGPYYPNYTNGEHSEDIIIKQTQELLESKAFTEDWKVYVFTMNSPCLARNTHPCMLNLVWKAQEWWNVYGVKTHIGYVRCWGFKGTKEYLFSEVDYKQVDCINQTKDHEDYVNAANKRPGLDPLCKNLSCAVKRVLRSVNSPLTFEQGQDWKSYFKKMHSICEDKPEDEKKVLTQELNTVIEAARVVLIEKSGSLDEHLESGETFTHDYTFSPHVSDVLQGEMRLTFQQCWGEMVRDKYAEMIREKLIEDFNQCAVQLFIRDIAKFTGEYLQIGRIQFPEESASCLTKS